MSFKSQINSINDKVIDKRDIESINAETMKWSALREKEDGSRFNTTFTWKKIK